MTSSRRRTAWIAGGFVLAATAAGAQYTASGNVFDLLDKATRKVGQVFLRNPGDTANMGDATTPVRVDPTGSTTQPVSGTVTANQGGAPWGVNPTAETTGVGVGAAADAEAAGNGSVIALLKRLRTLLGGGLPAALDGSGFLKTHEQGTATVSGTVTANQGGTWTVQPGNTANTTPWLVDLNKYGGTATTLGQKTMSASEPVVLASDQAAFPPDGTTGSTALGAANATVQIALAGYESAGASFLGGNLAGTVTALYSNDGGATFPNTCYMVFNTGQFATSITLAAGLTSSIGFMAPPGASHVQLKVTSYTSGSTNVSMRAATIAQPLFVRNVSRATFTATYRLTTRPYALSNVFGAAGLKQYATIYHAATAVKLVRIQKVTLWIKNTSAAAVLMYEMRRLSATTAPATGNPAITPMNHNNAGAAAETTCLALPTTAGSESNANNGWGGQEVSLAITGGASAVNPPPPLTPIVLYQRNPDAEELGPQMAAGLAGGYTVIIDASAATTVLATVEIEFTEE